MAQDDVTRRLAELNEVVSKHAGYQSLPDFVTRALGLRFEIDQEWRGDANRYAVVRPLVEPGQRVDDVGANTGFFALSLAHDIGAKVVAHEPNEAHAEILRRLATHFELPVEVRAAGVCLEDADGLEGDVVLLLNVLHHAGREFDHALVADAGQVLPYVQRYVTALRRPGRTLVFQLGYRWGGSHDHPIVDPSEPGRFLAAQLEVLEAAGWSRVRVLYPRSSEHHAYAEVDPREVERIRSRDGEPAVAAWLDIAGARGEFHRRPLFVCRVD